METAMLTILNADELTTPTLQLTFVSSSDCGSKGWDMWEREGRSKEKRVKDGANPYKQYNPGSIFTTLYDGRLESSSEKS